MNVDVPEVLLPADALGRVHFVGIGGAGLSGIARVMLERGLDVTGSDSADSPVLATLTALGARCFVGHAADQVAEADTVVVSTAVRADNPEVVEARRRGLRLLPRSAALDSVMQGRRVVAVAGTHGKTTTTSLLVAMLRHAGADPSYAVGGNPAYAANAHHGAGDLFVAEADESDGAFLVYSPSVAVVTNVAADHLDHYGTEERYRRAFEEFLGRVDPEGLLVACADDPGAAALVPLARTRGLRTVTAGESPHADVRAQGLRADGAVSTFAVHDGDHELGTVRLQVPGRHYVLDALCALAAGLRLGYPFGALASGAEGFGGTGRRMEPKGEVAGVRVYDSYAHHPGEIVADLEAARSVAGRGRVVVAFQPHLVSRTRAFGAAMGRALGGADAVVVTDVYLAREDPDPTVTGRIVADAVPLPAGAVDYEPSRSAVVRRVVERARPGDLVLTLGAGDVTLLGPQVLELLAATGPEGDGSDGA